MSRNIARRVIATETDDDWDALQISPRLLAHELALWGLRQATEIDRLRRRCKRVEGLLKDTIDILTTMEEIDNDSKN